MRGSGAALWAYPDGLEALDVGPLRLAVRVGQTERALAAVDKLGAEAARRAGGGAWSSCSWSRPTPLAGLAEALSDREVEDLKMAAAGLSNQDIAARVFVSLNTVKSHLQHATPSSV